MLLEKYEHTVKKHRFIAYRYKAKTKKDVLKLEKELRAEHKKAKHIVYAYRLGLGGPDEGMNNDKEPSGTAAMPILMFMKIKGISNEVVFVVRYWGGSKLGSGLLLRSYSAATKGVLNIKEEQ